MAYDIKFVYVLKSHIGNGKKGDVHIYIKNNNINYISINEIY
jgi:hypothetical protein